VKGGESEGGAAKREPEVVQAQAGGTRHMMIGETAGGRRERECGEDNA